jgi:hypothetical protein
MFVNPLFIYTCPSGGRLLLNRPNKHLMLQSTLARFVQSDSFEMIKLLGILATALISVIILIVNVISNRRKTYSDQITSLKAKYIEDLRQHLSEYLSLALECNKAIFLDNYKTIPERHQLIKDLDQKYTLISLFLNNKNPVDRKLSDYIQDIRLAAITQKGNGWKIEDTIQQMVNYGQQVLLLEWRTLKTEAKNGYISPYEMNNIRENFMIANHPN